MQQLVRNAVLHRTYETTNAPVRVYWYSDRIEIHSPGGLYGQVNPENFGQPQVTDYRNPLLAEAMKALGFVQRFGVGCVAPFLRGIGDVRDPHVERITDRVGLVVGDPGLSSFEDMLSDAWPRCLDRKEDAFRVTSSFHRILVSATQQQDANLALIDVGPNLGAINRAAILAADSVVVPLAPDVFSLQGLKNLGPRLRDWRRQWADRLQRRPADPALLLPRGDMNPVGYVILQHAVRLDRPVKAYERWMSHIPATYRSEVLDVQGKTVPRVMNDPNCLASLKNYRSLMTLAQDALKPMFYLKAADGALGGHLYAVQGCHEHFKNLAIAIANKCGVQIP